MFSPDSFVIIDMIKKLFKISCRWSSYGSEMILNVLFFLTLLPFYNKKSCNLLLRSFLNYDVTMSNNKFKKYVLCSFNRIFPSTPLFVKHRLVNNYDT